jgi:hypothetical protein
MCDGHLAPLAESLAFVAARGVLTACTMCTRSISAPAAMRRGTSVSAASSSADRMTTLPFGVYPSPFGHGPPVVTIAAMCSDSCDLPTPGLPAIRLNFPRANRSRQSHLIFCGLISEARIMTKDLTGAQAAALRERPDKPHIIYGDEQDFAADVRDPDERPESDDGDRDAEQPVNRPHFPRMIRGLCPPSSAWSSLRRWAIPCGP